ncbi:MAG: hypothetical protein GWO24_28630, partial [Akkermansiaceae bacterium]|nr:hypothetical protein [Akkermansiaceae bacterium]
DGALDEGEIQELFDAGPIGAGLPSFTSDPLVKPDAESGQAYSGPTLAGDVVDWDSPPENLEFAKVSGPDWLTVTADGT